MDWALQDAKNWFSEVVQRARREGPQIVTLRGERAAVVLSAADYDALVRDRPSLVDDLLSGPAWDGTSSPTPSFCAPNRQVATRRSNCTSSIRTLFPRPAAEAVKRSLGCGRFARRASI